MALTSVSEESQVNLLKNVAPRKLRREVRTHNCAGFFKNIFFGGGGYCNLPHPCDYSFVEFKWKGNLRLTQREEPFMETSIWGTDLWGFLGPRITLLWWSTRQGHPSPRPSPPNWARGARKTECRKIPRWKGSGAILVETWIKPTFLERVK